LQHEKFDGPNSNGFLFKDQIIQGRKGQSVTVTKIRDTSSGTVAEKSSVCLSLGMKAIIFSISLLNPISNRRSASSRTRTLTPLSRVEKPGVFSR